MELKPLIFSLTETEIKSNIDEINNYCINNDVRQVADLSNTFSKNERNNFLSTIIVDFANLDLQLNSNFFEKFIKYFQTVKDNPIIELNIKPKHEDCFCNNGFELFDHILNAHITKGRGRYNDISYFYWRMSFENKYIHQRPESFKNWFYKIYKEELGKIKTLDEVKNTNRDNNYSTALDWFN